MSKKGKTYRRFIRSRGKLEASPAYSRKADANKWYQEQLRLKQLQKGGIDIVAEDVTFMDYSVAWYNRRRKSHGAGTYMSDDQRLRDYLLPELSEMPMHKITPQKVKKVLQKVTEKGRSIATRDRVKALASSIFSSALNEDPPIVEYNPVTQVKFNDRRVGKKKPVYFPHTEEVEKYLINAFKKSPKHFAMASLTVMSGLRKSEVVALQWKHIDLDRRELLVCQRVVQASLTIERGTKKGIEATRIVPLPKPAVKALKAWRKASEFPGEDDFIFYQVHRPHRGRFVNPKVLSQWHNECLEGLERRVTVHGLRHTYGREFVKRGGQLSRLKSIMGHSSLSTTGIYSDLADETHEEVADLVTFNVGGRRKKKRKK